MTAPLSSPVWRREITTLTSIVTAVGGNFTPAERAHWIERLTTAHHADLTEEEAHE